MRRLLWLATLVVIQLAGGVALAQRPGGGGEIQLYTERNGQHCYLIDTHPGFADIHMVDIEPSQPYAVTFSATKPRCWTGATWVSDNFVWPLVLYNTQNYTRGVAVAYGGCLETGPVYLGYMRFWTTGEAPACCRYTVNGVIYLDDDIVTLNCGDVERAGTGGEIVINPDQSCMCELPLPQLPLPTQETSWGQIKSLYQ